MHKRLHQGCLCQDFQKLIPYVYIYRTLYVCLFKMFNFALQFEEFVTPITLLIHLVRNFVKK